MKQKLTYLITSLLATIVSLTGIINQEIYSERLNDISLSELLGQDIITFIISLFFLILTLFWNGVNRLINTILLGCLAYLVYVYAYFSFSVITSPLYILYIIIFSLSLYTLVFKLSFIILTDLHPEINSKYPRKTISYFFIIVVLIMLALEIPYLMVHTIITSMGINIFDIYCILDLAIVFPGIIITAIMNFKKHNLAITLSGIFIIKILLLMPALIFNDLVLWINTNQLMNVYFDIAAIIFTLASIYIFILYKRGIE